MTANKEIEAVIWWINCLQPAVWAVWLSAASFILSGGVIDGSRNN